MNRCDGCKHKDGCVRVPYGCECFELDLEEHDKQIRADAIDEFLGALVDKSEYFSVGNKIVESSFIYNFTKIAEQLKENKDDGKNCKTYRLNELKVRTIREFICSTEHFKPNEICTAREEDDKYVVRVHGGDMWVTKNEFGNYFEIIDKMV